MVIAAIVVSAFLIGCVCGVRSMTAPAPIAWGARPGRIHPGSSQSAFLGRTPSAAAFSLPVAAELVADKFPSIPNRTSPGPLTARIAFAAICASALCIPSAVPAALGAVVGGLLIVSRF